MTARGNVCPICRGDFFSAEEMVAHLKIGCKPPPAAPVVHVEVAEAEPDGDHSDEDGAPKTATDRFLKVGRRDAASDTTRLANGCASLCRKRAATCAV